MFFVLLQMHGGSAKFSDLYELQEDIGVGSYSICKRCVHRSNRMMNEIWLQVKMTFFDLLRTRALSEQTARFTLVWATKVYYQLKVKCLAEGHVSGG